MQGETSTTQHCRRHGRRLWGGEGAWKERDAELSAERGSLEVEVTVGVSAYVLGEFAVLDRKLVGPLLRGGTLLAFPQLHCSFICGFAGKVGIRECTVLWG